MCRSLGILCGNYDQILILQQKCKQTGLPGPLPTDLDHEEQYGYALIPEKERLTMLSY